MKVMIMMIVMIFLMTVPRTRAPGWTVARLGSASLQGTLTPAPASQVTSSGSVTGSLNLLKQLILKVKIKAVLGVIQISHYCPSWISEKQKKEIMRISLLFQSFSIWA